MDYTKRIAASWLPAVGVCAVLLLLSAAAAARETAPVSALEVKYRKLIHREPGFAVYLLEIPAHHASVMHRHDADILTVFISDGETKSTIDGRSPVRDSVGAGEVRFRQAGFTHSTENEGDNTFRAVIFEFTSPAGDRQPSKPNDTHACNPGSETACVDERYVLCTAVFCVKDVRVAPGAVWRDSEHSSDQMLVAQSDYELSYEPEGAPADVRQRKSGTVDYFRGGSARQWTNAGGVPVHITALVFRSTPR